MKNIKIALWGTIVGLTALWLAANPIMTEELSFKAVRDFAVQYSGVLSIGAMSIIMVLATRAKWIEPWVNGLDKSYRLHKWLGITAVIAAVLHWIAAMGPKWLVSAGLMTRPEHGPRGTGTAVDLPTLQQFFREQRGLAEHVGEWAFYVIVALVILALIKRLPYKLFVSTHTAMAIAFLALAAHSVVLLGYEMWTQPVGVVSGTLLIAGVVSTVMSLAGLIGKRHRVAGRIDNIRTFSETRTTEVDIAMNKSWEPHRAGQFAFVTFDEKEGKHPFTIASAWDPTTAKVTFMIKELGDYTNTLASTLKLGADAQVEGPYGRFTFQDQKDHQIWIGAGIGIAPFVARMKELALAGGTKTVDFIHSTKDISKEAMDSLMADAEAAGIQLHVLVDDRDGYLSGERLRAMVPQWKASSVWFCGPSKFGQTLKNDLTTRGLAKSDFHQEAFGMR